MQLVVFSKIKSCSKIFSPIKVMKVTLTGYEISVAFKLSLKCVYSVPHFRSFMGWRFRYLEEQLSQPTLGLSTVSFMEQVPIFTVI